MAEEEVVRLDVGVDDPHAVDELDETEQLGRQVDRDRLDDRLVRVLGQVDQIEQSTHPLVGRHQNTPVPRENDHENWTEMFKQGLHVPIRH